MHVLSKSICTMLLFNYMNPYYHDEWKYYHIDIQWRLMYKIQECQKKVPLRIFDYIEIES